MTTAVSLTDRRDELAGEVTDVMSLLAQLGDETTEAYREYVGTCGTWSRSHQDILAAFPTARVHIDAAWRALQYALDALDALDH
jgi:hypothetical protein